LSSVTPLTQKGGGKCVGRQQDRRGETASAIPVARGREDRSHRFLADHRACGGAARTAALSARYRGGLPGDRERPPAAQRRQANSPDDAPDGELMTADKTPAQLYALAFGATLLLVGIVGFIADSSFDTGSNVQGSDLIIFEVNGWHNIVHILSGVVGLALWRNARTARMYALGFGVVYLLVTIWGFVDGNSVLALIPVDTADNLLHLAIAALGIVAGLASRDDRAPARTRAARA
jgi:hypothetical protein